MASQVSPSHELTVHLKLIEFRVKGMFCDVNVIVDGTTFRCHRVLLAAASEFFDSLFQGNEGDSQTDTVTLDGVDAANFGAILRLLYKGDVEIDQTNIGGLQRVSDYLRLGTLQELCEQFIREVNTTSVYHELSFSSKMNQFRLQNKYCDVNVVVAGVTFRCHRLALAAASDFFGNMFGGNFRESRTDTVVLNDMDANTFEEMLRFLYTGHVEITEEIVCTLLRASDFYGLDVLEKLCSRFIRANVRSLSISDTLGTLAYTRQTQKVSLMNVLSSYVMERFDELFTDDSFLELSFDDLNLLLSQRWNLSPKNEGPLLDALVRWLNHEREAREKYFESLIENVELQNVPEHIMRVVIRKFFLKNISGHTSAAHFPIIEHAAHPVKPALGLHIYMKGENASTRVYSANKSMAPTRLRIGTINYDSVEDDLVCMMGLQNYLYCLDRYSFRACTSLDISSNYSRSSSLRYPPAILRARPRPRVRMCNIENSIYVQGTFIAPQRQSLQLGFSKEQICQGFYEYDANINRWHAVPLLRNEVGNCSDITAYNNVLYCVAAEQCSQAHGHSTSNTGTNIGIQSLDYRTSKWDDLTNYSFGTSSAWSNRNILLSSVFAGRIYICLDSSSHARDFEIKCYDLRARRWTKIERISGDFKTACQLLPYENLLWAFGSTAKGDCTVRSYNAVLDEWSLVPASRVIGSSMEVLKSRDWIQAVLFKC